MPDLRARLLKTGIVRAFEVSLSTTSVYCELSNPDDTNSMNTQFQFRLNGLIITHMKVRPVAIDGIADHWELVACHETLGEFAIDDNEGLADPALTRFILEVRDASIAPTERRFLPNKGWEQLTATGCLALLESAGVIETRRLA
jgi:hypothetical protein